MPATSAMTPLRILVAHNVDFARPGGMSRLMRHIHEHVSAAGHDVELFGTTEAGEAARGTLARFTYPLAVRRRVLDAAHAGRPYDLVNVHEPSSAAVARRRTGATRPRVIVTSYGIERRAWELALEELRLGRSGPGLKTRISYPMTSLWQSDMGLTHADAIVCSNEEDRAYLRQRYAIAPDRIVRMHSGADEMFARLGAGRRYDRADRVLFAGTWRKNKGIEDVVPAFTMLAEKFPALSMTVGGAGVAEDVVRSAFPPAVRARVSTRDTWTEEETARMFAEHDLYLLPSLFEGTPVTLIEAMMSGLPVITTHVCGMKDVIQHDRNGVLIPTRSPDAIVAAVTRLVEREDDRARLGRAAAADARERYTWDKVAAPILRLYEARGRAVSC